MQHIANLGAKRLPSTLGSVLWLIAIGLLLADAGLLLAFAVTGG